MGICYLESQMIGFQPVVHLKVHIAKYSVVAWILIPVQPVEDVRRVNVVEYWQY
jgi:hypothetical protein